MLRERRSNMASELPTTPRKSIWREPGGSKGNFTPLVLDIHLSQHHALLGQVKRQQMHPFRFPQRDGSPQRFTINCQLDTAPLVLSGSAGLGKKPANDLFHLVGLHALSQNPAPGTVMRHTFSFD